MRTLLVLLCVGVAHAQSIVPGADPRYIGPLAPDPATVSHARRHLTIVDPRIPGIALVASDDARYSEQIGALKRPGVVLRNDSDKRIIGLSVSYDLADGRKATLTIDGLDTLFEGLRPGDIALSEPGWLQAGPYTIGIKTRDNLSDDQTAGATARVEWVVFDDGAFYGTESQWQALKRKAAVRAKFFKEALASRNLGWYVAKTATCRDDLDCVKESGRTPEEWNLISGAIATYNAHEVVAARGAKMRDMMRAYLSATDEYAALLRKQPKSFRVEPDSPLNGWQITGVSGWCSRYPSTSFWSTDILQCNYLAAADPIVTGGFSQSFNARCVDVNRKLPSSVLGNQITVDNPKLTTRPQDALQYAPRHAVYSSLGANYIAGWGSDTVTSRIVYGYVEPFAPTANNDGGTTNCFVSWLQPQFFGNVYVGDLVVFNDYLNDANTTNVIFTGQSAFGYAVLNEAVTQGCDGTFTVAPQVTAANGYVTPTATDLRAGTRLGTRLDCFHATQSAGSDPGGPCDPNEDCCCCLASGRGIDFCQALCGALGATQCTGVGALAGAQPPMPMNLQFSNFVANATAVGNSVVYGETETGLNNYVTIGSTENPTACGYAKHLVDGTCGAAPTKLGIVRTGSDFLLDSQNTHQLNYASVENIATFLPPGGVQAGDIPVAGDWSGDGFAKVGYYRAPGQWYLDANGNGVYDAGDLTYSFGGSPGDVPVVGDWGAKGRDCVGVFRSGFFWVLDVNCNGTFDGVGTDNAFGFGGVVGDVPVVGHWGGSAASQVSVVRCYVVPGTTTCATWQYYWVIDNGMAYDTVQADHQVALGPGSSTPNGPAPFGFGGSYGDVFFTGDWFDNGKSNAGVYRSGSWLLDDGSHGYNIIYQYGGLGGDTPLPGRW